MIVEHVDLLVEEPSMEAMASETWRVVIVVDRDQDDCLELKKRLEDMAGKAGLMTRTAAGGGRPYAVVNRVAVEELEAWYFGDWRAVREAFPGVSRTLPAKKKYRDPDDIRGGTWETFERILKKAGHFEGGLRKIEAARVLSGLVDPNRNRSRSFKVFCDALVEMARRDG